RPELGLEGGQLAAELSGQGDEPRGHGLLPRNALLPSEESRPLRLSRVDCMIPEQMFESQAIGSTEPRAHRLRGASSQWLALCALGVGYLLRWAWPLARRR